jgi:beta-glucanase (GH16 family)
MNISTHLFASFMGLLSVSLTATTLITATIPTGQNMTVNRVNLEPAFVEEFDSAPSFWNAQSNPQGRWKTNYYFDQQETLHPNGWQSRTLVPNGELQYYGDPAVGPSAFEWKDGVLDIVAQPNPEATNPITHGLPYLSGLITTEKSFAQETGYFEARVAYPGGKGVWPAFWLLPVPHLKDGWGVANGPQEIDIFESIGEAGRLYFTVFTQGPKGEKTDSHMVWQTTKDLSQFHTYGLLLTKKEIVWYLDDQEVRRVANTDFHEPAYMLLNLAIGGKWPGAPDKDTQFPARMRIDWVRAYRLRAQ